MAATTTTTTQSAASPSSPGGGEEKPQNAGPDPVKPAEESANDSLTNLIYANKEPVREDQVQNAVKFLSHPKVRGSPVVYRRSFLEKKGLTREEIDEAFRRVPDPPSNATSVEAASAPQASSQQIPSTGLQSQVPAMTVAPANPAPAAVAATSTLQQYRFHWSHAFYIVGILAASGAGSAVVFKSAVLPRLKAWIRKVVKEEDNAEKKNQLKPSLAEEAAEAAKQAASAAAVVAKASQELLNSKIEERKYFDALKGLIDVQVEEMKSMGNAIRKLETARELTVSRENTKYTTGNGPIKSTQAYSYVEQSEPRVSSVAPRPAQVNEALDVNSGQGWPSSAPASAEPTGTPYSQSYMDIMAMIQRGETPPGIKEINDLPPNPNQQPSAPRMAPRVKPWERVQQDQQRGQSPAESDGYPGHVNGNSYMNGKSFESSDYSWDRKSVKITEMEPETEERKTASYGIGSSELRGRGWVPPQPPSVAVPEAAAAIRQPKSSGQKVQVGKEVSMAQYHLGEGASVGAASSVNEAESSRAEPSGSSVTEATESSDALAMVPSQTEIQEEPDGIQV